MSATLKVLGLVGSLRENSISGAILQAIGHILPNGAELNHLDTAKFPLYNEDYEKENLPVSIAEARAAVNESDIVIIVTPEFNHGIPGTLKNALDWLSRPAYNSPMIKKPVIFMTHSPSNLGGVRAQSQLRETLSAMLCNLMPLPEIVISASHEKIHAGIFDDKKTLDYILDILNEVMASLRIEIKNN